MDATNSRERNSWTAMKHRCSSPRNVSYDMYGGRGVRVCDAWRSFDAFLADMGPRPPDTTLDRIDGSGHYEPGNCRWATREQQAMNRHNRIWSDGDIRRVALRDAMGWKAAKIADDLCMKIGFVRNLMNRKTYASMYVREHRAAAEMLAS